MNYKNIILTSVIFLFGISLFSQEQKEIKLDSFTEVNFEGSAQWLLIPSDVEKLVIESENEDVFNYIDNNIKAGVLTISTTDKNKNITKLFKSVTIKVYFKSIESVSLSGVGSVKTEEVFQASELTATLKGTGNMHLNVQCSDFTGNMQGTGALYAKGTSDRSVVRVEGVGSFEGYNFITTDMDVTVSGVGGATVFTTNRLTATINGVGSIKYKGDPEVKNLDTNGLGSIKKSKD
jgi:hypothetical protein